MKALLNYRLLGNDNRVLSAVTWNSDMVRNSGIGCGVGEPPLKRRQSKTSSPRKSSLSTAIHDQREQTILSLANMKLENLLFSAIRRKGDTSRAEGTQM